MVIVCGGIGCVAIVGFIWWICVIAKVVVCGSQRVT